MDAKQRPAYGTRICNEIRAQFVKLGRELGNELEKRVADDLFIARLVLLEPLTVVFPLQLAKELEKLRRNVRSARHPDSVLPRCSLAHSPISSAQEVRVFFLEPFHQLDRTLVLKNVKSDPVFAPSSPPHLRTFCSPR